MYRMRGPREASILMNLFDRGKPFARSRDSILVCAGAIGVELLRLMLDPAPALHENAALPSPVMVRSNFARLASRPDDPVVVEDRGDRRGTSDQRTWDNKFLELVGITQEDLRMTTLLNERQAAGYYLLLNERPTTKKLIQWTHTRIVEDRKTNATIAMQILFKGIPIAHSNQTRLMQYREKFETAVLEYEAATMQLLDARRVYGESIERFGGAQCVDSVRENEKFLLAREEIDRLEPMLMNLLGPSEWASRSSWMESLIVMVARVGMFIETDDRFSPYGQPPKIVRGKEDIVLYYNGRLGDLKQKLVMLDGEFRQDVVVPTTVKTAVLSLLTHKVHDLFRTHVQDGHP